MFERDYGVVQQLLTEYAGGGHFGAALVSDVNRRVVATVGGVSDLKVGRSLPAPMPDGGRSIRLGLGAQEFGQLVVWEPPSQPAATNSVNVWLTGAALFAWLASLLLALGFRR